MGAWAIRQALDANGFDKTLILSYAAKFASVFYVPRGGGIGPAIGDRRSYQMDPAAGGDARLNGLQEGAGYDQAGDAIFI